MDAEVKRGEKIEDFHFNFFIFFPFFIINVFISLNMQYYVY
jgi:hypothetical protein